VCGELPETSAREQALRQLEAQLGTEIWLIPSDARNSESLLGVQAYLQLHDMHICTGK
jgi:hypothetical protein